MQFKLEFCAYCSMLAKDKGSLLLGILSVLGWIFYQVMNQTVEGQDLVGVLLIEIILHHLSCHPYTINITSSYFTYKMALKIFKTS